MSKEGNEQSDAVPERARASVWRILTCVPVLTLVLLVSIDALLRLCNPVDALGFNSVDLWHLPTRINLCRRTDPDAALLGSSLLMVLGQGEKGKHYTSGNFPPYLQDCLSKATGQNTTCVNLCSGLQMPAEGYMIAESIADQPAHPSVIICGLALRDFIDGDFTREWTLTSFQSVAPFVPINREVLSLMGNDNEAAERSNDFFREMNNPAVQELIVCHYWFLYRDRTGLKSVLSAFAKDWLEYLPLDQSFVRLGPDHQFRPQRFGYLWETWVPRRAEKFTEAIYQTHPEDVYRFEFARQASIYARGSEMTRTVQIRYMDGLIALCRARGIKLIIINMPLGPAVSAIVPAGLNGAYREYMRAVAEQYGLVYLDLFADPDFKADAFKDGVHLNFKGCHLLVDRLVSNLKDKHPDVLAALCRHAASRQRDPELKARQEGPYTVEHLYD